ncbi:MAG: ketoacyl-ACP synthase III [Gemmatimonadetes bacterium]|nr:ketoacyl-ACP synthase III [Gemmatimonadota bacterium]
MSRPYARITGTGHAVPAFAMQNSDFASLGIDTSDAWIRERTGIRQRYIARNGETCVSLAADASRQAMAEAGVTAADIDLIVFGTCSPDKLLPAAGVELQAQLGASKASAFDLNAACTSFVYGLSVGEGFIASGAAKTVLVIGAEKLSGIINWKDRNTCVLFGDGAGAAVLQPTTDQRGIIARFMRSDGNLAKLLYRPKGGSAEPVTPEIIAEGSHLVAMAGRETFKHAVYSMNEALDVALADAGLTGNDIDLLIPHQANLRIIEATAKHGDIPMDKVYVNVDRYGNTSAASVPIALDECMRSGRILPGMTVMMVAFGAGFTWSSAIHRF